MEREYEITREKLDPSTVYGLPPIEEHEFLIGVFLPHRICNGQRVVGHTVIWYMHQNKEYVLSFTPEKKPNQPRTPWKNTCCPVPGKYESIVEVSNDYVSDDDDLYKKLLYKITYIDKDNGERKIDELRTIHQEYMEEKKIKYKGLSTALCCYPKHNCTTIITSLLPGLGLQSDLNHPFLFLLFNLIMMLCIAYWWALFDQIHYKQNSKTTSEKVSVASLWFGIVFNLLYFLYRVFTLCLRERFNNCLFKLSCCRKGARDALEREYLNQRLLAIFNIIFFFISLFYSLLDCTCPKKRYLRGQGAILAIAFSVEIVFAMFAYFVYLACMGFKEGVKNPYALRDVLDRASVPKRSSDLAASADEATGLLENGPSINSTNYSQESVEEQKVVIKDSNV